MRGWSAENGWALPGEFNRSPTHRRSDGLNIESDAEPTADETLRPNGGEDHSQRGVSFLRTFLYVAGFFLALGVIPRMQEFSGEKHFYTLTVPRSRLGIFHSICSPNAWLNRGFPLTVFRTTGNSMESKEGNPYFVPCTNQPSIVDRVSPVGLGIDIGLSLLVSSGIYLGSRRLLSEEGGGEPSDAPEPSS